MRLSKRISDLYLRRKAKGKNNNQKADHSYGKGNKKQSSREKRENARDRKDLNLRLTEARGEKKLKS